MRRVILSIVLWTIQKVGSHCRRSKPTELSKLVTTCYISESIARQILWLCWLLWLTFNSPKVVHSTTSEHSVHYGYIYDLVLIIFIVVLHPWISYTVLHYNSQRWRRSCTSAPKQRKSDCEASASSLASSGELLAGYASWCQLQSWTRLPMALDAPTVNGGCLQQISFKVLMSDTWKGRYIWSQICSPVVTFDCSESRYLLFFRSRGINLFPGVVRCRAVVFPNSQLHTWSPPPFNATKRRQRHRLESCWNHDTL